ncbi:MAG: PIN domain-containing protein [bacterium]
MKNQKIIVDTSIWIEYFKNEAIIVDLLERKIMNSSIYMVGPIVSELLQCVRSEAEYNKLEACIDAIPYFEVRLKDWKKAGNLSSNLRKKGITIPLTDIIISAIAINKKAEIYTKDKHFHCIPGISLYKRE